MALEVVLMPVGFMWSFPEGPRRFVRHWSKRAENQPKEGSSNTFSMQASLQASLPNGFSKWVSPWSSFWAAASLQAKVK